MGSQTPSVRVAPEYIYTDGEDAVKILAASKLYVDPWQANVLNDWMGRTDDDVWTAPTCGLSVPRQNGKTLNTSGRITSGMVMGMQIGGGWTLPEPDGAPCRPAPIYTQENFERSTRWPEQRK